MSYDTSLFDFESSFFEEKEGNTVNSAYNMAQPYVPAIDKFDPHGDSSKVGQQWKRWKRGCELFLQARGDTPDGQKKALLLHTVSTSKRRHS
jgi:hypothetical protein